MEMQKQSNGKRRRKVISRPVLVRSVKPGQVPVAVYAKENTPAFAPVWKAE